MNTMCVLNNQINSVFIHDIKYNLFSMTYQLYLYRSEKNKMNILHKIDKQMHSIFHFISILAIFILEYLSLF